MKTATAKTTGGVKHLSMDLDSPVPFKMLDMEFNKLNMLTGLNGTGKSFINICVWVISTIAQVIVTTKPVKEVLKLVTQDMFNKSFKDQAINGTMSIEFDSGANITVKFVKGTLDGDVLYSGFEDINTPLATQYMSSAMRTFTAINAYLNLKATIKRYAPEKSAEQVLEEVSSMYRLYDIFYVETLIAKMPMIVDANMQETFEKFEIPGKIIEFGVDEERGEFFAVTDKGDRNLASYSAGHQSLLNMFMGAQNKS